MAHERHAHFLQDAGLHQPGVKRVAKVMKADVADRSIFQGCLPGALDDADGLVAEGHDQSFRLAVLEQMLVQPLGQRNLS